MEDNAAMTTFDPALVERVARAICGEADDCSFDALHDDKADWIDTRGFAGGRYRDVNELRKPDYLAMALAAITAAFKPQPIETAPAECIIVTSKGFLIHCRRNGSGWESAFKLGTHFPTSVSGSSPVPVYSPKGWLPLPPPVDEEE